MTIAERLRMEKKASVGFAPREFMELVEKWFNNHEYDQWLTINTNFYVGEYPNSKRNIANCMWNGTESCDTKRYWSVEYIGVPSEHFQEYAKLLAAEGFCLYRDNEHDYKVSLNDVPCIHYGYNTWYRVRL